MPDATARHLYLEKSGILFPLDPPDKSLITIEDIAHNLSRIPRWNGNTCRPISVAEHSILVMQMVEDYNPDPTAMMQALLHDATEAYIGDIPAPFKDLIPAIGQWEKGVLWPVIAKAFDLPVVMDPAVKKGDWIALFVEAESICKRADVATWDGHDEYGPAAMKWIATHGTLDDKVQPHPEMMEKVFTDCFLALQEARRESARKN